MLDVNMYQWSMNQHPHFNAAGQLEVDDFAFTPWMVAVWVAVVVAALAMVYWGAYGA